MPVHDPRNIYASDSPVIEDPDSDEELYKSAEEVAENIDPDGQGDGAANESNSGPNVCSFYYDLGLPLLRGPKQPRSFQLPQQSSTQPTAPVSHPSRPSFSRVSRLPLGSSSALPRNLDRADQYQGALGDSSVCDTICGVVQFMTPFSELQRRPTRKPSAHHRSTRTDCKEYEHCPNSWNWEP